MVRVLSRLVAVAALLAVPAVLGVLIHVHRHPSESPPPAAPVARVERPPTSRPDARKRQRRWPRIKWRASTPLGSPSAGRLLGAVRLPAEGEHFATWDPVLKRSPNRWWRRNGTDGLVRVLLRVTSRFAAAHPDAPRVLVGDLSRPRGGDFGRRFGPLGHVSHENGLDADVYFPRRDRSERAASRRSTARWRRNSSTALCGPARNGSSSAPGFVCAVARASCSRGRTTTITCTCASRRSGRVREAPRDL
jgi:hypothetical protein